MGSPDASTRQRVFKFCIELLSILTFYEILMKPSAISIVYNSFYSPGCINWSLISLHTHTWSQLFIRLPSKYRLPSQRIPSPRLQFPAVADVIYVSSLLISLLDIPLCQRIRTLSIIILQGLLAVLRSSLNGLIMLYTYRTVVIVLSVLSIVVFLFRPARLHQVAEIRYGRVQGKAAKSVLNSTLGVRSHRSCSYCSLVSRLTFS